MLKHRERSRCRNVITVEHLTKPRDLLSARLPNTSARCTARVIGTIMVRGSQAASGRLLFLHKRLRRRTPLAVRHCDDCDLHSPTSLRFVSYLPDIRAEPHPDQVIPKRIGGRSRTQSALLKGGPSLCRSETRATNLLSDSRPCLAMVSKRSGTARLLLPSYDTIRSHGMRG